MPGPFFPWKEKDMIRVYEVQRRESALMAQLLEVWEASVRATHRFLSEQEIRRLWSYVPQALAGVDIC